MADYHSPEPGKRSLWERPMSHPGSPPASYQGQQQAYQEPYQQPYQQPHDQTKGYYVAQPQPGYDHGGYSQGGQAYGQQQQQPQVVYVNNKDKRVHKDDVALGFCAGCATGLCCCGCTVM